MKQARYLLYLISLLAFLPSIALAAIHPGGTNVISGQQVYLIPEPVAGYCTVPPSFAPCSNPTLRAYPSATVFLSYPKNSWANITQANSDDLALPKSELMPFAPGTLVNDNGTIYVMADSRRFYADPDSTKHGIPNAATFLSLGYGWSNVIAGDTSFMTAGEVVSPTGAHLPGTLVNDNGTIYYITQWGKIGITSMDEFNSKGFDLKNVVPANGKDKALSPDSFGWIGPLPA